MNALKCRTLGVYKARMCESWKAHLLYIETQVALYTTAHSCKCYSFNRSSMLVLPQAVTSEKTDHG